MGPGRERVRQTGDAVLVDPALGVVSDEDPTLTTTRVAAATSPARFTGSRPHLPVTPRPSNTSWLGRPPGGTE